MAKAFRAQPNNAAPEVKAPGYDPNGVGEWSRYRAAAHRAGAVRLTTHGLARKHRKELSKLRAKLATTRAPEEREKIKQNIEIKTQFLARIEAELGAKQQ